MLIDSGNKYCDYIFTKGDIVIVSQSYISLTELIKWSKEIDIYPRLKGIFYVFQNDLPKDKKVIPLGELRKGWKRTFRNINTFCPDIKRIFVLCDTNLLEVIISPLKGFAEITNAHGSIFTLDNGMELVPTFEFSNWNLEHLRVYMQRDILRLLKLTKPKEPLLYETEIPKWLKD